MTTIKSPQVIIGGTPEALLEFSGNPMNLESLLPADKISNFQATETELNFTLPGGIRIVLGVEPGEKPGVIRYVSKKGTPIRFHLDIHFEPSASGMTQGQIVCEADLNPFTKMMAEKPLQALFDHIAQALVTKFPV
ncbi:MAG: hypothetical protein ACPGYK_03670 [Flavobacteriales bacterium]